jgi:hypothetical protein
VVAAWQPKPSQSVEAPEPVGSHPIPAFYEKVHQSLRCLGIGQLRRRHGGFYLGVRERSHNGSTPERVAVGHVFERRHRVHRFPELRLEQLVVQVSDGRVKDGAWCLFVVVNVESECEKAGERVLHVEAVRLTASRIAGAGAIASQGRPEVYEVMCYALCFRVVDVEGVLLFHVRVVEPGGDDIESANLSSMFVTVDVVRIVSSDPGVRPRSDGLAV